jgi:hypothetical protein
MSRNNQGNRGNYGNYGRQVTGNTPYSQFMNSPQQQAIRQNNDQNQLFGTRSQLNYNQTMNPQQNYAQAHPRFGNRGGTKKSKRKHGKKYKTHKRRGAK